MAALLILPLLAARMMLGCAEAPAPPVQPAAVPLGQRQLLLFQPDAQYYLSDPQPFPAAPETPLPEVLQALARQLSETYFASGNGEAPSGIQVVLQAIHTLPLPQNRRLTLVVVDLQDPRGAALQGFFQGSSGGQTTFHMLAATLLQPQLEPPLADGLFVLYNGGPFPALDHIDLRGIVIPAAVHASVGNAIYRRQRRQGPSP